MPFLLHSVYIWIVHTLLMAGKESGLGNYWDFHTLVDLLLFSTLMKRSYRGICWWIPSSPSLALKPHPILFIISNRSMGSALCLQTHFVQLIFHLKLFVWATPHLNWIRFLLTATLILWNLRYQYVHLFSLWGIISHIYPFLHQGARLPSNFHL